MEQVKKEIITLLPPIKETCEIKKLTEIKADVERIDFLSKIDIGIFTSLDPSGTDGEKSNLLSEAFNKNYNSLDGYVDMLGMAQYIQNHSAKRINPLETGLICDMIDAFSTAVVEYKNMIGYYYSLIIPYDFA